MVEIRNSDELISYLQRVLEIESGFEQMSQWESYINVKKDEFRDVIFGLISESEQHRAMVEDLISRVKRSTDRPLPPIKPREFVFKNKTELEIMMELSKYEKLAYDLYKNILEALKRSDVKNLIAEKDVGHFFATLNSLVNDESEHQSRIARYVGMIERIR
ncbi:MAG: hypothetical protein QXN93_00905 [Methanomassiliicoccales archaeon]